MSAAFLLLDSLLMHKEITMRRDCGKYQQIWVMSDHFAFAGIFVCTKQKHINKIVILNKQFHCFGMCSLFQGTPGRLRCHIGPTQPSHADTSGPRTTLWKLWIKLVHFSERMFLSVLPSVSILTNALSYLSTWCEPPSKAIWTFTADLRKLAIVKLTSQQSGCAT
jgi:hypothetical protein